VSAGALVAKVAVLVAVLAPAGAAVASTPMAATESPGAEVCFPAASWSARSEDRPCDVIGRPMEDGSGSLTLGTLGADAATCVIPNPYEERGRFVIHCRRVPNR
jgi:hypothetical protein